MKYKKLAILVIASIDNGPYNFLINEVWSNLIEQVSRNRFIDIYLLFDRDTNLKTIGLEYLRDNIIINNNTDHNSQHICVGVDIDEEVKWDGGYIPGLLSKTIYAFSRLVNKYDVFYRTNLTSIPHLENLWSFVNNNDIIYSGFAIWVDSRKQIRDYHLISNNSCLKDITYLDKYKGNCFVSGSGFFLNRGEVTHILRNRKNIRYDLVDDVSIGLLVDKCSLINNIASNYVRLEFHGLELKDDFSKINFSDIINKIDNVKDPSKILDIRMTHFSNDANSMKILRKIWEIVKERYPKGINYSPGFGNRNLVAEMLYKKRDIKYLQILQETLLNRQLKPNQHPLDINGINYEIVNWTGFAQGGGEKYPGFGNDLIQIAQGIVQAKENNYAHLSFQTAEKNRINSGWKHGIASTVPSLKNGIKLLDIPTTMSKICYYGTHTQLGLHNSSKIQKALLHYLKPKLTHLLINQNNTLSDTLVVHLRGGDAMLSDTCKIDDPTCSTGGWRPVIYDEMFYIKAINMCKLPKILIITQKTKQNEQHPMFKWLLDNYKNISVQYGTLWEDYSILCSCSNLVLDFSTFSYTAALMNTNLQNIFIYRFLTEEISFIPNIYKDIGLTLPRRDNCNIYIYDKPNMILK